MRHIPSVVPADVQNATALILQDEMTRRLSRLRTIADWGAMLEELSASRGRASLVLDCALAETIMETNHYRTGALSLSTGSSLQPVSRRG